MIDEWLAKVRQCIALSELDMKQLCEKVNLIYILILWILFMIFR